jgi:phytoene dehydrogenase-like protein
MPDPDVVVIGAGHNGLICAAYLARAGLRVQVVERRQIAGGCAATEEMAPGVRISRCFCDHLTLHTTPIPTELELERYGLENLSADPFHYAPSDGDEGLVFWKDLERTTDAIAERNPKDARAYRRFVREWGKLFESLQPVLLGSPRPAAVGRRMAKRPRHALGVLSKLPLLQRASKASLKSLLDETFEDPHLKGVLAFITAGMAGLSPSAPQSALLAFSAVLPHRVGVRRPRGGSGGLIRALVACLEHHGGTVRTGAAAERIEVTNSTVRAVRLADGEEISARLVVAACDPLTTFQRLLDPDVVPEAIRVALSKVRVANGFAMKVEYLIDGLPEWAPHRSITAAEQAAATKLICPSIDYLEAAYTEYLEKRNPGAPALLVGTASAMDPGLVPANHHLLTVETRYSPYELERNQRWSSIRDTEARRYLQLLQPFLAADLRTAVQLTIPQTPEDLERDLGLPRGHITHLDVSPEQMLHRRPIPQLSGYRTPLRGLYLTGAGTHPGGSIWGAPGYNAAHQLLADIA